MPGVTDELETLKIVITVETKTALRPDFMVHHLLFFIKTDGIWRDVSQLRQLSIRYITPLTKTAVNLSTVVSTKKVSADAGLIKF